MRKIPLIVLAALAGAAVTAAPGADAAPLAHELFGVSCVTARNCLAVGENLNTDTPLAQTWNGTAWKVISVKLPPKTSRGALDRVTCRSATRCLAVGSFDRGTALFALADWWDGKTWSPVQLPGAGGGALASGVSCASVKSCVAVGTFFARNGDSLPLADIWNGSKWTQTKAPVPKGTVASVLSSVSCVSANFCVAAGEFSTNSGGGVLISKWNGKAWSRLAAVVPKGSSDGFLTGVSCLSAKMCIAVGAASSSKGLASVAERWNGSKWALTSVPWPKGTKNPEFTGVSCVAASKCVAVGVIDSNLQGASNTGRAAAAVWNGKGWAATPVAGPGKGKASLFTAVACLTAKSCVAVGQVGAFSSTNGAGLSGFWNGQSWRLVTAK